MDVAVVLTRVLLGPASSSSFPVSSTLTTPQMRDSDIPDSDHDIESFPPSRLGEYKVVEEIAEGTFGKVKSASSAPLHTNQFFLG